MHYLAINFILLNSYNLQKRILVFSIFQFILKITAWYLTGSLAILTDGLESIINIIGSVTGLAALWYAMLPRDKNHPYGHGKIEFLSASFEGLLIAVTGVYIFYESYKAFEYPRPVQQLDWGLILVAASGLLNFFVGLYCVKSGKNMGSQQLIATGKHLKADAYSTMAMFAGLIVLYLTQWWLLDNIIAMVFCFFLVYTGYTILKDALGGILDEADESLLNEMTLYLENHRRENWVDLHNLRIIKYGSKLHLDCHLTVPWYFNVHQAHDEVDSLQMAVDDHFGSNVELFVHTDGCLPYSCSICQKMDCSERKNPFEQRIAWTLDNISRNEKHNKNI